MNQLNHLPQLVRLLRQYQPIILVDFILHVTLDLVVERRVNVSFASLPLSHDDLLVHLVDV